MIVYLHGFSSASSSNKATRLKAMLADIPFYVPDYPAHDPDCAIALLGNYIAEKQLNEGANNLMLMGSSLGGFYALYLAQQVASIDCVALINPALEPQRTLAPYIGEHENMVNGERFEFTGAHHQSLAKYDVDDALIDFPVLVLLDEGDEIIDYRVAEKRFRYSKAIHKNKQKHKSKHESKHKVVSYAGGDHWFQHLDQAKPHIIQFYQQFCDSLD